MEVVCGPVSASQFTRESTSQHAISMLTNYTPDSSAPQHRDGVGTNHIRARENPGERPRTERTGRGNKSHKTSREMCHFHRDKFTDLGNRNSLQSQMHCDRRPKNRGGGGVVSTNVLHPAGRMRSVGPQNSSNRIVHQLWPFVCGVTVPLGFLLYMDTQLSPSPGGWLKGMKWRNEL